MKPCYFGTLSHFQVCQEWDLKRSQAPRVVHKAHTFPLKLIALTHAGSSFVFVFMNICLSVCLFSPLAFVLYAV